MEKGALIRSMLRGCLPNYLGFTTVGSKIQYSFTTKNQFIPRKILKWKKKVHTNPLSFLPTLVHFSFFHCFYFHSISNNSHFYSFIVGLPGAITDA
jgi:hypothetical protein